MRKNEWKKQGFKKKNKNNDCIVLTCHTSNEIQTISSQKSSPLSLSAFLSFLALFLLCTSHTDSNECSMILDDFEKHNWASSRSTLYSLRIIWLTALSVTACYQVTVSSSFLVCAGRLPPCAVSGAVHESLRGLFWKDWWAGGGCPCPHYSLDSHLQHR